MLFNPSGPRKCRKTLAKMLFSLGIKLELEERPLDGVRGKLANIKHKEEIIKFMERCQLNLCILKF